MSALGIGFGVKEHGRQCLGRVSYPSSPGPLILLLLGLDSGRFHLAASKGLTECLTILLANGADINSKNEDGELARALGPAAGLSLYSSRGGGPLLEVPAVAPPLLSSSGLASILPGLPSLQAGLTSPPLPPPPQVPGTRGTGISGPVALRASLSNLPLIICASLAFPPCESPACRGPPTFHLPLFLFPGSTALHLATISCQPQCVKVLLQVRATSQYCFREGKKGAQNLLTWSCSHMQSLVKWTALIPSKRGGNPVLINSQTFM